MVYVDTSVLVALHFNEVGSAKAARWYAQMNDEPVSAMWCVTEFASAISIKLRTGQITAAQGEGAWKLFERMSANDLRLLPVTPATFHRAATLILEPGSGLRAGDALHLSASLEAGASSLATLDATLAKNALRCKLQVPFP